MGSWRLEMPTPTGRVYRPSPQRRQWGFVRRISALMVCSFFALRGFVAVQKGGSWMPMGKAFYKTNDAEKMLASCDKLRQQSFFSEEVMYTIRHWPQDEDFNVESNCIDESISGSDYHCQCKNPTIPAQRNLEFWQQAFQQHQALAEARAQDITPLDVVFLGDSITEHWLGNAGGQESIMYAENRAAFEHYLTRKGGGAIDSLAFGIAADQLPNMLYRLRFGGFLNYLKPNIWWILVGSNDIAMGWCNADVVLAGNIALVEEIRAKQPNAKIVINSILPRLPAHLQPHIDEVNTRLRQYACETKSNVYFFNATSIFRDSKGNIQNLPDGFHPDGPSSWTWAKEIARTVEELSGMWWG